MDSIEKRTAIFETMPYRRAVCKQIIPAITSQMIALVYNLADTYFVGMLGDPNQTAAVTVAAPSFVMLTAISNLFGIGGASIIAASLGKREVERARQTSAVSFWAGLGSACLFSLIFFMLASPILRLSGATDEIYAITYEYAKWVVVLGGSAAILNTAARQSREGGRQRGSSVVWRFYGRAYKYYARCFSCAASFCGTWCCRSGDCNGGVKLLCSHIFYAVYIHKKKINGNFHKPRLLKYASLHIKEILKTVFHRRCSMR